MADSKNQSLIKFHEPLRNVVKQNKSYFTLPLLPYLTGLTGSVVFFSHWSILLTGFTGFAVIVELSVR